MVHLKNDLLEYELIIPKTVEKYLLKLYKNDKKFFDLINKELIEIANHPQNYPKLHGKFTGCHKARKSNYRIIFEINEKNKEVYIVRVGKRSNIYKFLSIIEKI